MVVMERDYVVELMKISIEMCQQYDILNGKVIEEKTHIHHKCNQYINNNKTQVKLSIKRRCYHT